MLSPGGKGSVLGERGVSRFKKEADFEEASIYIALCDFFISFTTVLKGEVNF